MRKTFVIIVHYGRISATLDCLRSIAKEVKAFPVILVNNSLDPGLADKIKSIKCVKYIIPGKNLGFSGANNLAVKTALANGADCVILLNNDTVVSADLFQKLEDFAFSSDKIGLVSPKIYFYKGFEFHKNKYRDSDLGSVIWYAGGKLDWDNVYPRHRGVDELDQEKFNKTQKTDFATGCCMLIKKAVIGKIGLLEEKYFLYFEDVAYSVSCTKVGFDVLYYPHAFLWHKNAASSQGSGSLLQQYYQTRNRLYFGFKFAKVRTKLALIRESARHIKVGGIKRKAVLDFYMGRMGQQQT